MLFLLIGTVFLTGINGLVCPPITGFGSVINGFTDGGDGSCYSQVNNGYYRSALYTACGLYNSYMPIVQNAFQNAVVQQKAQQGTEFGHDIPGMWLGLVCLGNDVTSCSWDDGTPMTASSYKNFGQGSPNTTIGACVYLDTWSGLWTSESCSGRSDIGNYCKFTPTNNVPMCNRINLTVVDQQHLPYPWDAQPSYFNGNCYVLFKTETLQASESVCNALCGHVVSIHTEAENSFVRDLLYVTIGKPSSFNSYNSSRLGLTVGSPQWTDGTNVNYTNYAVSSPPSGLCAEMSFTNETLGKWVTFPCDYTMLKPLVCKKPLLNACDTPLVPFPTSSPVVCNGAQNLSGIGRVYSPGYPYYPFGEQPDNCAYVLQVDGTLHPAMTLTITKSDNFLPGSNVNSSFSFYSSPTATVPFYKYNASATERYHTIVSPSNYIQAVYSTMGDVKRTNDWESIYYNYHQKLSCSYLMDYSYLGNYNAAANSTYSNENHIVTNVIMALAGEYDTNEKCQLENSWNLAAFGNVNTADSVFTPANYSTYNIPIIPSTDGNFVSLCSAIDNINAYSIPPGTENTCLVFFSGQSSADFSKCNSVKTSKFQYIFGVGLNGQNGISTVTSNYINATSMGYGLQNSLMKMIVQTIRPSVCS